MLKALELVGFKSFADKTRFAFPPGITVVVGPNGSGKSNIVDAIKWVLGEQSVKSLRGKEMADVIFNGSPTRRGMNSAEITLTFENAKGLFPIDTPEVHITRRVYRGGEGEYLINRNPCRLRDIRDMLAGTGLGAQAYSVIEQGKVDVLLQASPKDRRVIFEEAAGISRFKLKKLEALRRLERVEQNLLRLSDIVDEVESRLRGVRAQAGKARRYKEHTDRLQELRTQAGAVDWRRLSEHLAGLDAEIQCLAEERDASAASAEALEARLLELETASADVSEALRQGESRLAANRERIAAQESAIEHERNRGRDVEQEMARHRRQLAALSARAEDLTQQLHDTAEAARRAEEQHRVIAQRVVEGERALTEAMARLDHLRGENEQHRSAHLAQARTVASLDSEIGAWESQVSAAAAARERSGKRLAELERSLKDLSLQLDDLLRRREQLDLAAEAVERQWTAARDQLAQSRRELAGKQNELAELRQRRSAAAERAAVLEELERRQEGLNAGVKEVLKQAASRDATPFRAVYGLVADLLSVSVEVAPLIEVALGPAAQHVVAAPDPALIEFLRNHGQELAGRVGFIWLEAGKGDNSGPFEAGRPMEPGRGPLRGRSDPYPFQTPAANLEGRPGVLGRADRFVEAQLRFVPLVVRLLGNTWLVEKLAQATQLAQSAGRGAKFVTVAGELLEADGTLVVGPRQAVAGLISRRSHLRALQAQLAELAARVAEGEAAVNALQAQIERQQEQVQVRATEHRRASEALSEQRMKITAAEERRAQFEQQRAALTAELQGAAEEHQAAAARLADARRNRQRLEAGLSDLETRLAGMNEQIARLEAERQSRGRETTEAKVELAKSEERLRALHARQRQFEESRQERGRAMAESREQLAQCVRRGEASRWNILRAESEIAELYLRKENFAAETVRWINHRETLRQQRGEMTAEAQQTRASIRKAEERLHALQLAANEVRHEREALAARLREDYGIELAQLEQRPSGEEQRQREVVQREIDELRQKIGNLGHVNLEALEELESLETRFKTLSEQYKDLAGAKASLEKIIDKINTDSRRLFAETLDTVKGHFQTLFRDLFGGGHGDIVLDEGVDILESGIEIVARPPGKEPRSISLLSGGEKTLTCVALLLAMFRSRPSPFCVLDEVDAALDEANIDRFTKVLQDFLTWTQFIIVTHSKKTMTCANTIYGVTMQESGVSKQVSVRFEDVSDDGHISPERLAEMEKETQAA